MLTRRAFLGGAAVGLSLAVTGGLVAADNQLLRFTPEGEEASWSLFTTWCTASEEMFRQTFFHTLARRGQPEYVALLGPENHIPGSRICLDGQTVDGGPTFSDVQYRLHDAAVRMARNIAQAVSSMPLGTRPGYACNFLPSFVYWTPQRPSDPFIQSRSIKIHVDMVGAAVTYRDLEQHVASGGHLQAIQWLRGDGRPVLLQREFLA